MRSRCGGVVFVDEATEDVAALDAVDGCCVGAAVRLGWSEVERAVRTLPVVVRHVDAKRVFEVAAAEDEEPVEALVSDRAYEPLGVSVRSRRADRCADDGDAFAAKHLVESAAELAVAVVDNEARPLEEVGEAEVAGLLGDPGAGWIRCTAGDMDAACCEFDEEEDVVAAQAERLDGEEVAGDDAGRLLAEELLPTEPDPSRRWFEPGGEQDPPDAAG